MATIDVLESALALLAGMQNPQECVNHAQIINLLSDSIGKLKSFGSKYFTVRQTCINNCTASNGAVYTDSSEMNPDIDTIILHVEKLGIFLSFSTQDDWLAFGEKEDKELYGQLELITPLFQIIFNSEERTPTVVVKKDADQLQKLMANYFGCDVVLEKFDSKRYCLRVMKLCRNLDHCVDLLDGFSKTLSGILQKHWKRKMEPDRYTFSKGRATAVPVCVHVERDSYTLPGSLHLAKHNGMPMRFEINITNNITSFAGDNNGVINNNYGQQNSTNVNKQPADNRFSNWITNNPPNGMLSKAYREKMNTALGTRIGATAFAQIMRVCGYKDAHTNSGTTWAK